MKVWVFEHTKKWKQSDEVAKPRMLRWLDVPTLATHKVGDSLVQYRHKKVFLDMIEGLCKA